MEMWHGDRSTVLRGSIAAGIAAGLLDIAYAIGANAAKGMAPETTLQAVASGLLGRSAFQGGTATALLGGFLHFGLVIVMALLFIITARRFESLRRHLLAGSLVYGALIYFGMRWIIVPLSNFPGDLRTFNPVEFAVHVIGVGLVIALVALWLGSVESGGSIRQSRFYGHRSARRRLLGRTFPR